MAEENFGKKLLNITFQNHNVSYAEKLMLKRHRRTELTELPSPRLETHVTTMEDWKQRQMLRNSINGEKSGIGDNIGEASCMKSLIYEKIVAYDNKL